MAPPPLGETEVPDRALLDELVDRAGDVLDRHGGSDAVLVGEVDTVGLQALDRGLRDLIDVAGAGCSVT